VSNARNPRDATPPEPPVRDRGPVEGVRGNREVPPANPAETASEGAEQDELGALQAERDELFDRLQRLAAEFDNFRKRAAREQGEMLKRANERLVKELLPVLDDLGRALDAAEEHQEMQLEEGVRLVHRSLASLLEREGLAEIETDGKFDPHVHEALLTQPSELEEGSILEVIQKGYRLGDRVLRPARVVVSAVLPAPPEEAA
jgi:molecular chaperone GrpE